MIPNGLFTQIALVILSVGIVVTYIKPAFEGVAEVQDQITAFQTEREKIDQVNLQLKTLTASAESVSLDDKERLLTYMPNSVDTIAVPRDLTFIAQEAGVILKDVSYGGVPNEAVDEEAVSAFELSANPSPHMLSLTVQGNYSQIKNLFAVLEQNNYPLEVHNLEIQKVEGGFLEATVDIVTYERFLPADVDEVVAN